MIKLTFYKLPSDDHPDFVVLDHGINAYKGKVSIPIHPST